MAVDFFRLLSFLCCLLGILISQASSEDLDFVHECDYDIGNYTANSTYDTNLNTLLSSLSSNTEINYGFYNFSYGKNNDKVYAIGLCRGDVFNPDECRSCLNDSSVPLKQLCPNQKEAIGWHKEHCMLRYSNRSIFHILQTEPWDYSWTGPNSTQADQFNQAVRNLLDSLRSRAASGDSRSKFAVGNATFLVLQTIYGLMQCTPDLSHQDCNNCLITAVSKLPSCCEDKIGARIFSPSCYIRYEITPFYQSTISQLPSPTPPSSTNHTSPGENSNTSRTVVIALVVPAVVVVVVVVLIFIICFYFRGRKARNNFKAAEGDDDKIQTAESLQFDFDTIRVATSDFSDSNKLGQGGFGAVYKGQLPNGQAIAVKRLSSDSNQGVMEFKNEVLLVAKLQHRNLVRLFGFCLEGRERLLVYEFVPNKSLNYFIFDPTKQAQLHWEARYKIIGGVARGLLYLHEDSRLRIIHRDLKASNVLLDDDMNPKISDFGIARLFVMDQTQGDTSRIVGTYGYMAPEYAMHGQFSVKSDVFSFGVLVLEILTGQKNSAIHHGENVEDLLSFAWKNWKGGTAINIIDPTLKIGSRNEMMRCIHIGLLCVQENVADRPTMAAVVLMLNSDSVSLAVPSEPAFFVDSRASRSLPDLMPWEYNSRATTSSENTRKSAQESTNEASITEL